MHPFQRRFVMKVCKILGGVACLSLLLGTGALAEMVGGEPGTSKNPKDNVPQEIQRDTPSGGDFGKGGSGPGERSDALSGKEKEKAVEVTEQGLEQNAEKTHEGGAAVAAEELKEKSMEKSDKDISAQSSHKGMKKDMKKK
jgi:hypothetical protein